MKTIKLRAYHGHNAPLYIFLGVLVLLFAVNALTPQQAHVDAVQPTPALIYVLSTPVPTVQPTPDTQVQAEIAALKARVAELEARRNAPAAEAPAVYQQMTVQEQTPAATPYVADAQIEYSAAGSTVQISVPTDAPRLCDGFGDWRDYDAMYTGSPACHKATP
jgi:hypothetical protein